jgi:hypothetical protein
MASPRVLRGAFHRRCRTCGWKGTYSTAGHADKAERVHSCDRHLELAARHARGEARRAHIDSLDRTPQPCHHKRANHQHGQRATYVLDKCRCIPCSQANAAAEIQRERQKAYGRYDKYVDADPVRAHIRSLTAQGMGWKRVATNAGVSPSSMWKLLYGKKQPDGTQTPSKRITRVNAEKLLAVQLDLADGARVDQTHVIGVTRRMQALVALGWSQSKIADRLGIQRSNFRLTRFQWSITAGHARAAKALYDELSMQLPPEETHRDKIAASRARKYAAERGWLPPLALDDDLIDDPDYVPAVVRDQASVDGEFDEAAIYRRMHGDKSVSLTKAEKSELARRWLASGRPLNEMERITGVHSHRHLADIGEAS